MSDSDSSRATAGRRNLVRAAIAHVIVAWLFVRVADVVLPYLGVVDQPVRWALVISVASFPITLLVGWLSDQPWTGSGKPALEVLGLVGVAVLAGWWVMGNLPEAARDRTSLVVMPFTHADDDREQGLARALTYEITIF